MKITRPILFAGAVSVLTGFCLHAQTAYTVRHSQIITPGAADSGASTLKFSGTVTDGAGQPVAGATVEYWRYAGNLAQPGEPELDKQITTGADGAYEFQVPRGMGFLLARKPGLAPAWRSLGQPFNRNGQTDNTLALTSPGMLAGLVLDESNQPVAKAEVSVRMAFTEISLGSRAQSFNFFTGKPARELFAGRTDGAGRFRIENFPTNANAIFTVHSPGKVWRPAEQQPFDIETTGYRAGQEDIKLVVEPAGGVEGKISLSDSNQPPPIARLTLQPEVQNYFLAGGPEPVPSGADGSFRFDDVAAGSYRVQAAFGTHASSEWVAEPVPVSVEAGQVARGVQVTATHGALLEVFVLGKEDRKPMAKVSITAFRANSQSSAESDGSGIARFHLLPGDYQIMAMQDSLPSSQTAATVEAGVTNRVEVEIAAPKKISGVVRTPNGQPAAGVPVQMIGAFGALDDEVKTDANGKFEFDWNPRQFPGQNDATMCVLVRDAEHNLAVAQDLDEDTTNLDLKLAPALTLAGRVEADGKPITNATAQLIFMVGRSGMWLQGLARTNTPGHYEIPALPPGRKYGVAISAPGYGQKQMMNLDISADPGRQELDPMELMPANLKIAGQVLDADDQPVAGCNVQINGEGQPNAQARTDHDGRFVLAHVCAGSANIFANAKSSFGNISAEGGDTNVVVRLGQNNNGASSGAPARKLNGLVTDPDGKPDAGAQVAVFPSVNGSTRWIKTGPGGEYKLTWSLQPWQLQNGGARIIVRDPARGLAAVEELTEDTTNLDVKLKAALTLTGQVKNEANAPLPGAQISLMLKAGNSYNQLDEQLKPADAQGRFEIKCLPADGQYLVHGSANGYGTSQQTVESNADTNRLELSPLVLKPADQLIAGQVVNEDDKPVSGVNVNLNGDGQPGGYMSTDSKGRFHFKVCAGSVQISANGQGSFGTISAEGGDTNVVLRLGQNYGSSPGVQTHKLKGLVTDTDGKPAPGAQVAVFPNYNGGTHWIKSGPSGEYNLTWSLQPWQLQNGGGARLVVRDPARGLAAFEELPEDATNLDVKLKPALGLTGLVKNEADTPMSGAQVGFWIKAGNSYNQLDEQLKPANAQGRYEIPCLPADGQYLVFASAKGYGKTTQPVESDSDTNRLELSPLVLKLADQVIAGQVVKDDDKPASGVNVNLNGEGQPDGYMTTDSKGRFHFQVCAGQIRLFANSQSGGGFAQATVEAGDTNIVITLTSQPGRARQAPSRHSLKGSPLPDLSAVNLAGDAAPAGKAVLLCLFDAGQRPSRHVLHLLDQQAAALGQKNVGVLGVQAAVTGDDLFNEWKTGNPVSFPVGRVTEKSDQSKWASSVTALPWLILADASHRVVAEGFSLEELDAQIQKLAK